MNCESWLLAKKSFTAVATGFGLTRSWGISVSISGKVSLSLIALSILTRPILNWFSRSSPTVLTLLLPRWSISSPAPRESLSLQKLSYNLDDVLLPQRHHIKGNVEAESVVHLEPSHLRQVISFGAEEHVVDKGLRKLIGGRIARSQLPVYLEERLLLAVSPYR